MLHLLLGTRTHNEKCLLFKASKEWYYDSNVWKVVLEFGIYSIKLPYKVKESCVLHMKDIIHTPAGVMGCGRLTSYFYRLSPQYDNIKMVQLPERTSVSKIAWLYGDGTIMPDTSTGTGGINSSILCVLEYNRVLLRVKLNKPNCDAHSGITNNVYYLTGGRSIVAWIRFGGLYYTGKLGLDIYRVCEVWGIQHLDGPEYHLMAIDDEDLVYIVNSGFIKVYNVKCGEGPIRTMILEDPLKSGNTHVIPVYILIHQGVLHTWSKDKVLRAYTLGGELISRWSLDTLKDTKFTGTCSMCVHDGKLLMCDGDTLIVL
jgi:hypothetical protein